MPTLSIITHCYNEEAGIEACYEAVRAVMATKLPDVSYEHIFIDNASLDGTAAKLRAIAARDPQVRVILNARNFGPARSPFYGMLQASGDVAIPVFADLQTPPDLIPEMMALWRQGAKVVLAVKRSTQEAYFIGKARTLFYSLMKRFSKIEQVQNYVGYGLYDRCVVDALRSLHEPEPYFRGLIMEIGFERALVYYDQPPRRTGKSSYNLYGLVDYALLGLSSYSRVPLRMMTFLGFGVATLSVLVGLAYFIAKLIFWNSLPIGIAPVVIAVTFLGAVQLFALGVVGEYIGLILNYSRSFPLVIERERINFPPRPAEPPH